MIVNDVLKDVRSIFGECSLPELLDHLNDAVELLANKGDIDPLMGFADLCCQGSCITLPREVEVPLAVNIGGTPTLGRDQLFRFHYNGTGDCQDVCKWEWDDMGLVPTYKELTCPAKIVAAVQLRSDANKAVWIYGYDDENKLLRTQQPDGSYVDGWQVPTPFGYIVPDEDAPCVSRIIRIRKDVTNGPIHLQTLDVSQGTGTVISVLEWDEVDPQYRRIKLGRSCDFARIAYRKRVFQLRSVNDAIPLHSKIALKMALTAIYFYGKQDFVNGQNYEATASRLLEEKQLVSGVNVPTPIQVNDEVTPFNKCDEID